MFNGSIQPKMIKTCFTFFFSIVKQMSSSSKQDPRREEAIVPFHLPRRGEEEEDWSHMLATLVCKFFYKSIILSFI